MAGKLVKQNDANMLKLLPQSIEAEEAVLGAILVNPTSLGRIVELLKPESFYKPAHRIIYDAMLNMFRKNEPIDIVTISEYLRNKENTIENTQKAFRYLIGRGFSYEDAEYALRNFNKED